ncbi:MAG: hypothetical protein ACRDRX_22545 [Pseudonocardiaceae bacterium]
MIAGESDHVTPAQHDTVAQVDGLRRLVAESLVLVTLESLQSQGYCSIADSTLESEDRLPGSAMRAEATLDSVACAGLVLARP